MATVGVRRSAEELRERLDLFGPDRKTRQSAFWALLILSSLIASAGVGRDSTATVIGAMIIAPLSTPILGVSFGVVSGNTRLALKSLRLVVLATIAAIAIGWLVVKVSPNADAIATSSQVLSRTSPALGDLLAAVATGLAGSFALMRTDLGDALPGIAVAISLVPPLVVVGVCLGAGNSYQALGALILFLSNVAALIAACTLVLAFSGYRQKSDSVRAYLLIGVFLAAVAVPIVINTTTLVIQNRWGTAVRNAADQWVGQLPGSAIESVRWEGRAIVVTVLSPDELPPITGLEGAIIRAGVPESVQLAVIHHMGTRMD